MHINNNETIETLCIENRNKLTMNGVDTVDGFSEQMLKLTVSGIKVQISGENIKITSYNKASGNLTADGKFSEIKYGKTKTPFIKRMFK